MGKRKDGEKERGREGGREGERERVEREKKNHHYVVETSRLELTALCRVTGNVMLVSWRKALAN